MEPEVLELILDGRKKPTNLQFSLLSNITKNFSKEREIGKGGFAVVYKGVLPNGNVAVKRIMNIHTIDDTLFYREVDTLLAVNHRNIVQFLGYCSTTDHTALSQEGLKAHIYAEQRERLLCFEYISNGSLQEYITDELRGLEWNARYEIIKGICNGLDYLHNEKCIYHMDLKPTNVLLDSNMVPKITDFGQSRYDEKSHTMSINRYGSRGYCPPEYALYGKMSLKSDMYSLGMIIIELVTGVKEIPNNNKSNVLRRWSHRWRKAGMESPLSYQQVTKCLDIGLLCQEIEPCNRPFIWEIVRDINEMEVTSTQIRNENESTVVQISPYSDDDMLGIEPLELHFPFEINKEMSCSLELTNETDSYIAFEVKKTSPWPYCIEPHEGIVPPRSKCRVDITLQPQDKAPQRSKGFIVRSTRVNSYSTTEHTKAMFNNCMGTDVDEVYLDVIFDPELRGRVEDVNTRKTRYSLISDSGSKTTTGTTALGSTAFNDILIEAKDAARRWKGLGDLAELITNKDNHNDCQLRVISVWGTNGDHGITSVITKAYNDPEICQNFPFRVWVKLMRPFDSREFIRSFMAQVYANVCKEQGAGIAVYVLKKMEAKQEDLLREFVEEVNKKTYLVVLENLNDMVDWNTVRTFLPDMNKGSLIIVSTQQFDIASLCIGHSYQPMELKQFSPEHSVCAFFREGSQYYRYKEADHWMTNYSFPMSREVSPIPSFIMKEADHWMTNYSLVGREPEMNVLRRFTTDFNYSPVSVWGIAGVGKSTLVRNLYYDRMLHSNRFDKYIWVDVSHPINLRDFSRSIISDPYSAKNPIKECRELLSQHHCLVVIDDLQSEEEWDLIKVSLVSTPSTSFIIVITTEASIATYCTANEDQVFHVKGLEADAAMYLFTDEVQRMNPASALHGQKIKDLEELILKCGGLPKVIVSIASLLATQTVTVMDTVLSLNEKFMDTLETAPQCDSLRGLFDWMYSYFRICPHSLQQCISDLTIFPQGHNIRRRRLVMRWTAEGDYALDKGEHCFSKLVDMNIIQQIPPSVTTLSDTGTILCQLNSFIREYIVSRREENLVHELGPNCVLTTECSGNHLVILDTWDRDRKVFESINFTRLESLTVFGKWESFFISRSIRLLLVLDLEDAFGVKDDDLEKIIMMINGLKFLSLRGCSEICRVPSSLGYLTQLQTLDLRHTSIVTLPASIGNLQRLQYIRAGTKVLASIPPASSSRMPDFRRGCGLAGIKVPRAIGKLTVLHTLGVVNVGASGGKTIVEALTKLTQLRKLGVSGINRNNINEFLSETAGLMHLESLLVQVDENSPHCMDDISLPWENLQSLTLYGLQDKLPLSYNTLTRLTKLNLEMKNLERDGMEILARLQELCILRLRVKQRGFEDSKLHFQSQLEGMELDAFRKVKILEVTCSSSWLHVIFGSKSMQNLEVLKIDCSSALYELTGLSGLSELKEVFLKGSNDTTIKKKIETQLILHPNRPTVKLGQGIVPPHSRCGVDITLQQQDKAPQCANEFIVRSTSVNSGFTADHMTTTMFSKSTGNDVDEVNLDVVFDPELRGRVEDMSTRKTRYSLIRDSGSKPATRHQTTTTGATALGSTAFNDILVEARDAAMRWKGLGDLAELITNKDNHNDRQLRVISVWGTNGDHRTTSVITKAYNDPEICQNFPCRVWVKLMHPFDSREFIRRFMAQVYANVCEEHGAGIAVHVLKKMDAKQEDLLRDFVEEVNKKTYLVVLENLNDMVDWNTVRTFLPDMNKGSLIIVSTQQFEIAGLCIGHSYQPMELKQFSPEHSVCAFFKEGSQYYRDKEDDHWMTNYSFPMSPEVSPIPSSIMKEADHWITNYPLVGREPEMNVLCRFTTDFNNSPVISVWGIAGIGKSTLVRILYYDRMLHSNRFDKYCWVDVSHPINLRDFSRSLISDPYSVKNPIKECRELLSQHHCLVVIDDLQSEEEWDLIKVALVFRPSRTFIIVITTDASIATYCTTNEDQVFHVKGLEADAAMYLFMNEVQRMNPTSALLGHKNKDIEELILKCGGLPKLIVSIASLLATQTVTLMDTVLSLNDKFMDNLETSPECDSLRGLFDWMYSYFRICPDSLQQCISDLTIFPQGHNIRRRRLVMRWTAEGDYAVDKGEHYFSKLVDMSIIQQIPQLVTTLGDTGTISCQVNRFIHEYIVSRREKNLVHELGPNCVLTTECSGNHLVILDTWDRDRKVFESINFTRLESLTVFGKWESFFISRSTRLLLVLDLEDAFGVKDDDLEKIIMMINGLKFLSLRGCSEICRVPSSLGYLTQLQTLDLRHTSIVTLPASIGNLQRLQYIRAGTEVLASIPLASSSWMPNFRRGRGLAGIKVPRAIGKLTVLHTLGVVNVGASGGKTIVEALKKLTHLRKLGVSGINKHNINEFFSETTGLVHLESLLVQLDENSPHCMDDISLPWENLQSLTLYGLQDKLPLSYNSLRRLTKLDLEMKTLERDGMEILAQLQELCILRVRVKQRGFEDSKIHFQAQLEGIDLDTFRKVKILEVTCSSSWLHVIFGSKSMKNLELFKIDCSSALYELTGLHGLSELKEVFLKGTNDTAIKTKYETQLIDHPNKPTVKLGEPPHQS